MNDPNAIPFSKQSLTIPAGVDTLLDIAIPVPSSRVGLVIENTGINDLNSTTVKESPLGGNGILATNQAVTAAIGTIKSGVDASNPTLVEATGISISLIRLIFASTAGTTVSVEAFISGG